MSPITTIIILAPRRNPGTPSRRQMTSPTPSSLPHRRNGPLRDDDAVAPRRSSPEAVNWGIANSLACWFGSRPTRPWIPSIEDSCLFVRLPLSLPYFDTILFLSLFCSSNSRLFPFTNTIIICVYIFFVSFVLYCCRYRFRPLGPFHLPPFGYVHQPLNKGGFWSSTFLKNVGLPRPRRISLDTFRPDVGDFQISIGVGFTLEGIKTTTLTTTATSSDRPSSLLFARAMI